MLDLLKGIWDVISGLVDFVIHTITSLITLIAQIPKFLTLLGGLIGQIPPIYQAIMTVTLTISVIFLITGRGK